MKSLAHDFKHSAPLHVWIVSIAVTLAVLVIAWFVMPDFVDPGNRPGLREMVGIAVVAFFFPALFEETIFRGLLNLRQSWFSMILSTLAFIAWHPLVGLFFQANVREAMSDPRFLIFVATFGILFCLFRRWGKSMWVPILCHWIITVIWKGLGGAQFWSGASLGLGAGDIS